MPGGTTAATVPSGIDANAHVRMSRPRDLDFGITEGGVSGSGSSKWLILSTEPSRSWRCCALALADRQHVVERHAHLALPESEHGIELVGVEPDIDARLGEVHGKTPSAALLRPIALSIEKCVGVLHLDQRPRWISRSRVAAVRVKKRSWLTKMQETSDCSSWSSRSS
ncbi:MAG: hypothetical protein WDN03_17275 [Rhizomicrobium sp.]